MYSCLVTGWIQELNVEIRGTAYSLLFCKNLTLIFFKLDKTWVFNSSQCNGQVQWKHYFLLKLFLTRNVFLIKAVVYHHFSCKQLQRNPGRMWRFMMENLSVELALHIVYFHWIYFLYFYKTSEYTLDVTHQCVTWIWHDCSLHCNVFSKQLKEIEQSTPVRCASLNAVGLLLVVFVGVWNPLFLHYHLQDTDFFISNFTTIT